MNDIIKKYRLDHGSKLTLYYIPHNSALVPCWFDGNSGRQFRKLTREDFNLITQE